MILPLHASPWLLAIPAALVAAAAIEGRLLRRRGRDYDWKSYWSSLGDALGRGVVNRVIGGGVAGALLLAVSHWRIASISMNRWWHWALLFVAVEFCYYWMHRADHRIRWFWLSHAVHHSPNQFTLAAAYRLGWTSTITAGAVVFAPLIWLGFPLPALLGAVAFNLLYQFWLHTELIGRLPRPIEFVFNTPAHHRVHHASNAEYIDCNYGGVLIVFDRMFGTFRSVRDDVAIRYGLVQPLRTYNPLRIALHAWGTMIDELRRASGWRERLRVVFGPPEYTPRPR